MTSAAPKPVAAPPLASRVVIGEIRPEVDGGRFPAKACLGDEVIVSAQVACDGHDLLAGLLQYRHADDEAWSEVPLTQSAPGTDRWQASFTVDRLGEWKFAFVAWIDEFQTWLHAFDSRVDAGREVTALRLRGIQLLEEAARAAAGGDGGLLAEAAGLLRSSASDVEAAESLSRPEVGALVRRFTTPASPAVSAVRHLRVDPVLARCSAWYEFFPRSTGASGRHGSFETARAMLEYAAGMGFDVVYLPPIHPIGRLNRKGRNNAIVAGPDDPGSPWAIGSSEGGHRAIHPELGDMDSFKAFLAHARSLGLEVALDLAFQCAPDHPLISERPDWFRWEPDGTIAYAENPPKRYEDIVPFNFESPTAAELQQELLETTLFWVEAGVRVFRVDNPHTKPLPFWEWLIEQVKKRSPEVLFLAEAFARPALLHGLAKRGFDQSYTYFAWRNTKQEIEDYLAELSRGPEREYLRPNFWPNTPDILPGFLQAGGRPAFILRLVLAATLSASYGIYGPAFELCEAMPREPGSEEYLDSEKYQLRHWDLNHPWSLREIIRRVNGIRRAHPALHRNESLLFHETTNERLIAYSKLDEASGDCVVVVVNLDPHNTQSGFVRLNREALGLDVSGQYLASDVLGGGNFVWYGAENYVELNPSQTPAHIFSLRTRRRSERDFEYFF